MNTYTAAENGPEIWRVHFDMDLTTTRLSRHVSPTPFVPEDEESRSQRCSEILCVAALGLKQRMEHTGAKTAVVGLSGGLDSTLAVLITALAMQMLDRPAEDIIAVTMPCFGTTDRTKSNAVLLAERLGCTLRTVDISGRATGGCPVMHRPHCGWRSWRRCEKSLRPASRLIEALRHKKYPRPGHSRAGVLYFRAFVPLLTMV